MPTIAKNRLRNKKINTKNKKKLSFLFIFIFLILFFLLIINFSDIFSTIITHKGSLFSNYKIETTSFSVYGVSIKDFNNSEEATEYSQYVIERGGAGFIYESGEHFVLANAYQSLNEAQEIKANLYEEGLNFDKKLSNRNQINSVIAKQLTLLTNLINSINEINEGTDLPIKQAIIVPFTNCKNILEELLYNSSEDIIFSSKLKQTSINIVLENKNLVKQINNL